VYFFRGGGLISHGGEKYLKVRIVKFVEIQGIVNHFFTAPSVSRVRETFAGPTLSDGSESRGMR
jgi:hypothetical protein